jgi:hypothetical protein
MTPILIARHEPKFYMGMLITIPGDPDTQLTYVGEIPRELMDFYTEIVGNALARVSVSADMGIKEFGTGASALVTVSLSCNQDGPTIQRAIEGAGQMARTYAAQQRHQAEAELQRVLDEKKRLKDFGPR